MSVRLFLSIIGCIVALAIMPIGSSAIAQEGGANSQKEKLAELQAELRARQQVLENNRASAQELENVLKASELEIAKVAKALSSTRQSLKNIEQEQAKLEEEQEGLKTAIRKQQSLLSSQLKSAFMAGITTTRKCCFTKTTREPSSVSSPIINTWQKRAKKRLRALGEMLLGLKKLTQSLAKKPCHLPL